MAHHVPNNMFSYVLPTSVCEVEPCENANIPLQINQQLIIPTGGAPQQPRAYKPATRPTQPAPAVKASSPGVHTVQPGDTLFGIARKYAINPSQLMKANGLTPETANKIHVGAKLRLPSAN